MGYWNLTDTEIDNVTKILFGNQKQASTANHAVATLVAKELKNAGNSLVSQNEVAKAILKYLRDAVDGKSQFNEIIVALITGVESLAVLKSGKPCTITATELSNSSAKVNYRVELKVQSDKLDTSIDYDAMMSKRLAPKGKVASSTKEIKKDAPDYYQQLADYYCTQICAMAPSVAKQQIPDNKYALALSISKEFFRANPTIGDDI